MTRRSKAGSLRGAAQVRLTLARDVQRSHRLQETMKHPIIVGTDLTEASDDTLVQAEVLATRDSATLTVVHAISPLLWRDQGEQLARIRQQIAQRVSLLTRRPPELFDVVVERGLAHAVLARLAIAHDALLVVGAHMHHGIAHALLRDVTERVVARARGPVLVTQPANRAGQVLVPVDRPFESSEPLLTAIDEARARRAKLTVLHCVDTGFIRTLACDLANGGAYAREPLGLNAPLAEARSALGAELKRRNVRADVLVAEGEAQALIPRLARGARAGLIVVGSGHGKGSLQITNAVLRHAPCSVLVVDSTRASALDRAVTARDRTTATEDAR